MTDLDTWREFFNNYKIVFHEYKTDTSTDPFWTNATVLETDQGKGYTGFTFVGIFNKDGSFRNYGVWEQ